jgi:hypothetical protein
MSEFFASSANDGLELRAYRGEGSALLAMDLPEAGAQDLAGFAIECTPPGRRPFYLLNRLSFSQEMTAGTTPEERKWTPSDRAPFQKYRWTHFPVPLLDGDYRYAVTAMYFDGPGRQLRKGATTAVTLDLVPATGPGHPMTVAFTRGYMQSQAYKDHFRRDLAFAPANRGVDYDTTKYRRKYEWLGGHARQLLFDFLKACVDDPQVTVDLFAYDMDEPDMLRLLVKLGSRLRVVADNATLHKGTAAKPAREIAAWQLVEASAGATNVRHGKFARFAHSKVLIRKRNGMAEAVLTGSTNFSVRGLYVQANNMILLEDPQAAGLFEQAFEQSFSKPMSKFASSEIAGGYFDLTAAGMPPTRVAFSPHRSENVSLDVVRDAIRNAKSSVMYAVMQMEGGGDVFKELKRLGQRDEVFSYGVTQSMSGNEIVYKPGASNGRLLPFAYLKANAPPPFEAEFEGGQGQTVHHKFVVVDFNDTEPVVFTGSSNLAAGGEKDNGDNLLRIADRGVATMFAVEAVRLLDHFHFRVSKKDATDNQPLQLTDRPWWQDYYNEDHIKFRDRGIFQGRFA